MRFHLRVVGQLLNLIVVDKYDLSSVRRAISGGAPLGQEIIVQVYERTGIKVSMGLGMTETSGATAKQTHMSWEEMQAAPGSTGRFVLGVDAKLIDEDGKSACRVCALCYYPG